MIYQYEGADPPTSLLLTTANLKAYLHLAWLTYSPIILSVLSKAVQSVSRTSGFYKTIHKFARMKSSTDLAA